MLRLLLKTRGTIESGDSRAALIWLIAMQGGMRCVERFGAKTAPVPFALPVLQNRQVTRPHSLNAPAGSLDGTLDVPHSRQVCFGAR